MPTVIIPSSSHSTKEYAPLADEVNPPFGNVAPSPTVSNGAIVYSKPLRSSGSNTPTDDTPPQSSRVLRNISDDLTSRIKGKSRDPYLDYGEEGDIATQHRFSTASKGKERAWDNDGYTRPIDQTQQGSYPPLNEEEEEEKRVQANLAKFTAREQARRKAARASRVMSPSGSSSTSANSSTTSLPRSTTSISRSGRPLSVLTEGLSSKRGSLKGYIGSIVGRERHGSQDMELASPTTAAMHSPSNPYDTKPRSPTSPTMQPSSPFADPPNTAQSLSASLPLESPVDGGTGFGYAGPGWRGGAGAAVPIEEVAPPKPERWWHALCAWGNDLDGGHGKRTSNQAGRTNPFE